MTMTNFETAVSNPETPASDFSLRSHYTRAGKTAWLPQAIRHEYGGEGNARAEHGTGPRIHWTRLGLKSR
jgi:hypothetical protein